MSPCFHTSFVFSVLVSIFKSLLLFNVVTLPYLWVGFPSNSLTYFFVSAVVRQVFSVWTLSPSPSFFVFQVALSCPCVYGTFVIGIRDIIIVHFIHNYRSNWTLKIL